MPGLEELANNLWYSWDRPTRALFAKLNPTLWDAVGHSPKALLKRIDEQRLIDAAADPAFLDLRRAFLLHSTLSRRAAVPQNSGGFGPDDLVAYFCAEFGVHESLPIYSGGLGILAGDHCKAASDFQLPFVAVGLLYRQGYFVQTIDAEGRQRAEYHDSDFDDLPIAPVRRSDGVDLAIDVQFPGRKVYVKVWQARVGHVTIYLLDTDLPENGEREQNIAHRLYGGDRITRLEQELILGVAGARALAAVGLKPTVYHINEGHAAFLILERVRGLVQEGLPLGAAVEAVASNTVFTTHTPVPAGHDQFAEGAVMPYLKACFGETAVVGLGLPPSGGDFNMTALAIRGSRYQNGVSRIHGGVSAKMLKDFWPQADPEENPLGYVTNGVHVATFLAPEWGQVLDRFLGVGWMHRLGHPGIWEKIRSIPDPIFWSVRQDIKARLFYMIRHRMARMHTRNYGSESHLDRLLKYADPGNPNVLTIGFGRRFATYKRATLLFNDLDNLRRILADRSPDPVPLRRQGASGGRAGAGADPHAGPHVAPGGVFRPHPLHRGLRSAHRAAPRLRRGRLAEQPRASARSLRDFRHEGRHQRRDQPFDPGWLVGRGIRRRERLGHQAGLTRGRRAPPRSRGSAHAL